MITGTTKILGVIGHPIAHSLSPIMHNAAITQLNADYAYLPFSIQPQQLQQAIAGFAAIGVQGFNVTIPHKQAIMPLLSVSPLAQQVGAVNTVWRDDQGWHGTNTDVAGFLAPLQTLKRDWRNATAIVLGSGGAARAVVAGCVELGCAAVQIVGRDRQKLQSFDRWQFISQTLVQTYLWDELPQWLPTADLIVNTTPIGMQPHVDQSPVSPDLMSQLKPGAIAYDLIYTPSPTQFLHSAAQRGVTTIDGLEMLVQQGAAALEIWLQQPAPVDVMRRSLLQALSKQQS